MDKNKLNLDMKIHETALRLAEIDCVIYKRERYEYHKGQMNELKELFYKYKEKKL